MFSGNRYLVQVRRRGVLQHVSHADQRGGPALRSVPTNANTRHLGEVLNSVKVNSPLTLLSNRRQLWDGHGSSGKHGQRAEGGPALCGHSARLHSQLHVRISTCPVMRQSIALVLLEYS